MDTNPTPSKAERVHELMLSSLYETRPNDTSKTIIVEGIVQNVGFDPDRIEKNRAKIEAVIADIVPETFYADGGGGWSFLNLCIDKDGDQWGEHPNMEALYLLAAAIGRAKILVPREFWSSFPGGMPYIQFTRTNESSRIKESDPSRDPVTLEMLQDAYEARAQAGYDDGVSPPK